MNTKETNAAAIRLFDFFMSDLEKNVPDADIPTAMTIATLFIAGLLVQLEEQGAFLDGEAVFHRALATVLEPSRLSRQPVAGHA